MEIRPITNYLLPITNYHGASGIISTLVESALQIRLFMQNKPNFQKSQMNVSTVITMNYEQRTMNYEIKNKPNSKPIQTQYKPNSNPIQTQYKPKTKPIQTQYKPNTNPMLARYLCGGSKAQNKNIQNCSPPAAYQDAYKKVDVSKVLSDFFVGQLGFYTHI
jgi:hypothetical protein